MPTQQRQDPPDVAYDPPPMPYIDPKIRFWLGVGFSVATGVSAGGAALLHNAIPESWIPFVLAWVGLISFIGNIVLTALNYAATSTSSRAMSAAHDPRVMSVIMSTKALATSIPSDKVVSK